MSIQVPEDHLDLLKRPIHGVLTTMLPDGQPQSCIVWCGFDGECALVNTTKERQKGKNMIANPQVSLLIVDPENTSRYIQIQGGVEIVEEGAIGVLDEMTRRFTSHARFYGCVYPAEQEFRETRITCRIHPTKITLDAIHSAIRR